MIHVLIAEDEPPILRRIAAMVEQTDALFRVVGMALNGKEALRVMEDIHVDVLLTDIRMPVMDGLRLMEETRARYPGCIVVVLSGYQDYEYMAQAIRTRSMDYLLKPVSADTMRELLSRVKAQYLSASRERVANTLAAHISRASRSRSSQRDRADGDELGVCLYCAGGMPSGGDAEMYPGSDVWSSVSLESLAGQAINDFTTFTWEFMGGTPVERILFFQTARAQIEPWMKRLHEMAVEQSSMPVSCACASGLIPLSDVNATVKRLRESLRRHIRIGRSLFLCVDTDADEKDGAGPDDSALSIKLGEMLADGRIGQASPFKRELFRQMESDGWVQQRVMRLFSDAVAYAEKTGGGALRHSAKQYRSVIAEAVSTASSFKALEEAVSALPPLSQGNKPDNDARHEKVADDIAKYLREHFADSITNQTLAKTFGYVPSYVSVLFRRKYKQSPSEYLSDIRMGEAKKLMQETPGILVREVADRVGFKNQHHFSRAFKEKVGMWPTSYQS
ncbi:MAG: response regulator [Oscillospiraceae bacterium]|nr:response regulator [Oscillospiraceae bacterium]